MKELSNTDIENIFKNNSLFGGVINKDDLKYLGKKIYIVNLDEKKGNGTHWTMISNISPHKIYYFDSFGVAMPQHLLKLSTLTGKGILQNKKQYQMIKSNSCGEFCIYVTKELLKGRSFADILSDFSSKLEYNERLLKKELSKLIT